MMLAVRNNQFAEGEQLIIKKNSGNIALPYKWSLEGSGSVKIRASADKRAYSHGATVKGDGKVDSREIKIGIIIFSQSEEEHDEFVNELYHLFYDTNYQLITGRIDRQYNIASLTKFDHKFIKGFKQRYSDIKISLLLADPFRYAIQPKTETYTFTEAQTEAELEFLSTGNIDTTLIITFTPLTSMPNITLKHTGSNKVCNINDSLLTNPATLTVNTKAGTILRDTNNAVNAFSGQFLSAIPGNNFILYTGAAGTITISYTERWLL